MLDISKVRSDLERYLSIKGATLPAFSPDDSKIAYLSDATGVPQVWSTATEGEAWPQQLTFGQRVGFLSYARRSDRIAFGVDSGGDERFQIRVLDANRGDLVKVTDRPSVIHNWGDWSPDERRICFSSNLRSQQSFDIYVQSIEENEAEMVYQHEGNNYPLAWSPDSSSILFVRQHSPMNHDLYLLSLKEREVRHLTPHEGEASFHLGTFDESGRHVYCLSNRDRDLIALAKIDTSNGELVYLYSPDSELEGMSLSRDGRTLGLTVNDGGYSRLKTLDTATGAVTDLQLPPCVIGSLAWSNKGDRLALSSSSSVSNSDVWTYDLPSHKCSRFTHSSTSGMNESQFAVAEPFTFKSFDGLEVTAFTLSPEKKGGDLPLLVYLHGGPEGQFRPSFSPLLQYFVSLGFVVLAPNFRGSTGYGKRFTHMDDVERRMDTVRDSLAAVEEVRKTIGIDPTRIVAWGGSYGGFMVLACLYSEPDLWAAGVDIVGISNFVTFLKNTGPWRRQLRIAEYGDPDRDRDFLERISPSNNAHRIKAPLFVIHGANDPRVPIGEAKQIVEVMHRLGRDAQMMQFDDEGHGLTKLQNRILGYSAAVEFMVARVLDREKKGGPTLVRTG